MKTEMTRMIRNEKRPGQKTDSQSHKKRLQRIHSILKEDRGRGETKGRGSKGNTNNSMTGIYSYSNGFYWSRERKVCVQFMRERQLRGRREVPPSENKGDMRAKTTIKMRDRKEVSGRSYSTRDSLLQCNGNQ